MLLCPRCRWGGVDYICGQEEAKPDGRPDWLKWHGCDSGGPAPAGCLLFHRQREYSAKTASHPDCLHCHQGMSLVKSEPTALFFQLLKNNNFQCNKVIFFFFLLSLLPWSCYENCYMLWVGIWRCPFTAVYDRVCNVRKENYLWLYMLFNIWPKMLSMGLFMCCFSVAVTMATLKF